MPIIAVDHLVKTFSTKRKTEGLAASFKSLWQPEYATSEAVKGISFSVEPGETLAFIGPNGAGKSTTIKMLVGILYPTSGRASVLGLVPWQQRTQLAYHIGTVFGQKSQLWYHLPPIDTFALFARIYEIPNTDFRQRLAHLVDAFEIGPYLQNPVRKLSLGERMRCEIVASLLHRPQILFLDEPTIGLDVVVKQRIRDLILEMNQAEGLTIFLTSHDAGDVESLCKRAIIINQGDIVYEGRVSQLKREYLRSKEVDLKLADGFQGLDLPGVKVLKHKGYGVKLEVDTSIQAIEAVVGRVLERYRVVDITISNPPMEEIIRQIYLDN